MKFNITISYTLFIFVKVMFFPSLIYAPWTENNPPTRPENNILLTCAEWISFNGFALDNYDFNREKAMSRDLKNDRKATTWAAIYAFKIGGKEDIYRILPQEFCNSFGDENHVPKTFKALEDEEIKCEEWIQLYRFKEDNLNDNYTYAMNIELSKVKYISIYAYGYWKFQRNPNRIFNLRPSQLCSKMGISLDHQFVCDYGTELTCGEWMFLYEFHNLPDYNLLKARAITREMAVHPIRIHFFPDRYAFYLLGNSMIYGTSINQPLYTTFCRRYDGNGVVPERYSFNFSHQ